MAERRGVLGILGKKVLSAVCSPAVWIPALILFALTAVFRFTDVDVALVRPFFVGREAGDQFSDRWPLMCAYPWKALYDWGIYPGLILGVGGLLVWIASFCWVKLRPWRDQGLFYGLLLIVGPGIIINGVLKPYWGRPRPNAITQFAGPREFLRVWEWGHGQEESSFPSGHASMGFCLMAPAFVCYRRRPRLALAFLLLGLIGGGIMGLARVVAGGHFPSDVVWAGGLIYFTALMLAALFKFGQESPPYD
jgi:membrane-associated PAP2 superfamily phosphatase